MIIVDYRNKKKYAKYISVYIKIKIVVNFKVWLELYEIVYSYSY